MCGGRERERWCVCVYVCVCFCFVLLRLVLPCLVLSCLVVCLFLLLFLFCYFWAYRSCRSDMHWPIAGIVLVASLITPVNPGSISMFAYAGFFIGFAYALPRYLLLMTLLITLLVLLELTLTIHWNLFLIMGAAIVTAVSLLGRAEQAKLLHRMAEQQSEDEIWHVNVPPSRSGDLKREVDLIEEVARLVGYDRFCSHLPDPVEPGGLSAKEQLLRRLCFALRGAGLQELMHLSLVSKDLNAEINTKPGDWKNELLKHHNLL